MKKIRYTLIRSPFVSFFSLFSFILLSGCALSFNKAEWNLPPKAPSEISVMSYNLENLFDTEHTPGHDDYTFLPLAMKESDSKMREGCLTYSDLEARRQDCLNTNWTLVGLEKKLKNLASVILSVDKNGPDNLLVMEVETEKVLTQLNQEHLKKANYITQVIIDGPDKRGINVGFLSRFPLIGKPILHPIPWKPKNDEDKKWMERSRRILEVTVKTPAGAPLTFFIAHFPSQANPVYWREQVAAHLAELIKSKGPNAMVVAGGDLNITAEEENEHHIFRDTFEPVGAVSHFVGCEKCPGTHNFKKSWSFLDAQIYSKALLAGGTGAYEMRPETIDVYRYHPMQLKKGKYPNRWDNDFQTGVSDHFPLYVRLR